MALPLLAASLALLILSPTARASFHLIKVREVFPGILAHPNSSYVELQMYSSGQSLVQFGELEVFASNGSTTDVYKPGHSVTSSANQSTVLIADSEYASQFSGGPTPDFTNPNLNLSPAGGAVCWPQTEEPFDDCASWGDFSGQGMLASTDSAPASPAGIPDGMAIRRTIAPSCATLLEAADDTNDSAVDFSVIAPLPRSNSVAPTEHGCGGGGGGNTGGGGGSQSQPGSAGAPQTRLVRKPPRKISDRTPTFRFSSDEAGSSFQCKLDGKPFKPCRSPFTIKTLSLGPHTFKVRARDTSGKVDPSPASYAFRIILKSR